MNLLTETRNPATEAIDTKSTLEIVSLMNDEDATVATAVRGELSRIAYAVDLIVERLRAGGRLLYFGAGTSGRLGVLDAVECPPTFSTAPEMVQGIIAGGPSALVISSEEKEDDPDLGAQAVLNAGVSPADAVVGLSASGSTPYVMGALQQARELGAVTIAVVCNYPTPMDELAQVTIAPGTGPEVIAGSTRMKAGTAQKMVLNMLSTATMIRLGKVYNNLMVNVQPTSAKLHRRAIRILQTAVGVSEAQAARLLAAADDEVKTALVMALARIAADEARHRLAEADGHVRRAVEPRTTKSSSRGCPPNFDQEANSQCGTY